MLLVADAGRPARPSEIGRVAVTTPMRGVDAVIGEVTAGHGARGPAAQRDGGCWVAVFAAASDAVACALDLQRTRLDAVRLRACVQVGEARQRGEFACADPAVDGAARLLELAHDGQVLLSGMAADLVAGSLPDGAWLADLGSHRLADLAPAVRIWQLCHRDLPAEFPPLRSLDRLPHNLPVQLTNFIGRDAEMDQLRRLLVGNRLVTVTGAGGAGKTRLALQAAAGMLAEFPTGAWLVDLAPLGDPGLVPVAVARALRLPDEQGRPVMATLSGFIGTGRALVLLDNCEHLLEACAALAEDLLRACPEVVILATSREPVGAAGEATWRVPSLPLTSDAVDLFADRARRARPGFAVTADNRAVVEEICRRLDGIPLAIELAAARLRAFSVAEIAAGLHDRFRLLTGGSRTAVRRQQTLRASVDWSHALLTEPERVLFRRLASFAGGFDLEAAEAVGAAAGLERHHVLDQLGLLVDKSLVAAEESQGTTRYRLLETVRQYGLEKLGESGEADTVRSRHRDHYVGLAGRLEALASAASRRLIARLEADIDNLHAAFAWSLELSEGATALRLASSLQPLWLGRSRMFEGLAWFDVALAQRAITPVAPAVRVRALADAVVLAVWADTAPRIAQAEEAVATARQLGDPALLGRALTAAGCAAGYLSEDGRPYFEEAMSLAREAGDVWTLAQILGHQALVAYLSGDLNAARSAGEEGLALADETGNDLISRQCRTWLSYCLIDQGELQSARELIGDLVGEAEKDKARVWEFYGLAALGITSALIGQPDQARAAGEASLVIARDLGVASYTIPGYMCLTYAAAAVGDVAALREAAQAGWQHTDRPWDHHCRNRLAEADLAEAKLTEARQHSDAAIAGATRLGGKCTLMYALTIGARVAAAAGDLARAHDDAHLALGIGRDIRAQIGIIEVLEVLGGLARGADEQVKAVRLLGAADALRRTTGYRRALLYQDRYDADVSALRASIGDAAFDQAWAEGAALNLDDAVSYALRGRGERGRPASGWLSLTPAELDVARLVAEGLANREIAARLFISPRTVQTHLTHMYGKLGITSRVQLAQQAARRT